MGEESPLSRINLAGNIDSGGAKMLRMSSFILSFQWKHFCNYLTDRPFLWKDIEQSFISDATLKCVLCSNLSLHNRIIATTDPISFHAAFSTNC